MQEIIDFFTLLFDVQDWPPRWFCGYWSEFHGWLYIISDLTIWLAYFTIPIFILAFVFKKPDIPLPKVFWLFGAFILACGLTHLMDAIIFWWPAYRLSALIRFITAVVSLGTVFALIKFFPMALKLTTSDEFNAEIKKRKAAEEKLQAVNTEIKIKSKEVERFAYIASHDLQAPLNSFKQLLKLSEKKSKEIDDDELKEFMTYLGKSAERMDELVKGLLSYSRVGQEAGEIELVDLNQTLSEVLADLQSSISSLDVKVVAEQMPTIYGRKLALRLMFQNLIGNAIKFHHPDRTPHVTISSKEHADHWEFSVADNGLGIAEKELDQVFEIFRRASSAKGIKGTGIGLAHCQKIAEIHHGKIWVTSTVGEGSTFHFTVSKRLDHLS